MADKATSTDVPEEEILDAEIVEDVTSSPAGDTNATVLLSLEEMIKNHIASIDKETAELREKRHMFTDAFQNDATFKEHEEKAKEANVTKMQTRQQILKQPAMIQLAEKIKSMSSDLREKKAALSDYLLEYQRMTQATTIEDLDGNIREIVNDAKAVKRSSAKK